MIASTPRAPAYGFPRAGNFRAAGRRGITLMEVLISMFVLLIGLLSVGALIPVGRFQVGQGDQVDRAAAVGRSAFRALKVYPFLRPDTGLIGAMQGNAQRLPILATAVPVLNWHTGTSVATSNNTSRQIADPNVHPNSATGNPYSQFYGTGGNICVYDGVPACGPGFAPMAYALDPWAMAHNAHNQSIQDDLPLFPYGALRLIAGKANYQAGQYVHTPTLPVMVRMTTFNLANSFISNTVNPQIETFMPWGQAARICQPRDDLTYTVPLPGMMLTMPNTPAVQSYFPVQTGGPGVNSTPLPPQYRGTDGNYSWMVTLVPNGPTMLYPNNPVGPNPPDSQGNVPPSLPVPSKCSWTVSVVVFYKRDMTVSQNIATADEIDANANAVETPERLAQVSQFFNPNTGSVTSANGFLDNGINGGQVNLSTLDNDLNPTQTKLAINPGQWIMLCGQITLPPNTGLNPTVYPSNLNIFRWYRVVSAGGFHDASGNEIPPGTAAVQGSGPIQRLVTLAGPDWPVNSIANNYNTQNSYPWPSLSTSPLTSVNPPICANCTFAVICRGVVGVYEKTMELELPSSWGTQ